MGCLRWLVYSNVWVSLVAPSMLWFSSLMLGRKPETALYVFVFSATLFLYNVQRLYKAGEYLSPETLPRHRWIWEQRKSLQVMALLSGLSVLVCLFFVPFFYLLWLLPAGLVSLLYFIPFYPVGGKRKRLRDFPLFKIILVAFVWAWMSVVSLALMWNMPIADWLALFAVEVLFCFAITLPFDVRDAAMDRKEGIVTFVSRWGLMRVKWISSLCLLASFAALLLFGGAQWTALAFFAYFLFALVSVWFVSPQRHELYYGFWLDGIILFQGPVAFFIFYVLNI